VSDNIKKDLTEENTKLENTKQQENVEVENTEVENIEVESVELENKNTQIENTEENVEVENTEVENTEVTKEIADKNEKIKKELIEWIKTIVGACILAFIITQFIRPTIVNGQSMYPTLDNNDYLIINRMAYKVGEPQRGDIIVFSTDLKQDNGKTKDLVKRIIAVEGDHLRIEDSKVYVNDELLDEPYIYDNYTDGYEDVIIPEGMLFAMGDNRENSKDSRSSDVGLISEDEVMGKVMVRLFPFNKIGTVK
jgi:signal peptidase I